MLDLDLDLPDPPGVRDKQTFVGVVSALYLAALLVSLVAGPLALSALGVMSLGAAIRRIVVVVGFGYLLGMGLLLR